MHLQPGKLHAVHPLRVVLVGGARVTCQYAGQGGAVGLRHLCQQFGRELVDRLFRREHLYPISLYTAAGWKDLVRLADEGYGAAILPERSAARLEHCEVLPLENAPSFDFVCAVPRYAEPSPACMALIELARKHFATHG